MFSYLLPRCLKPFLPGKQIELHKPALQRAIEYRYPPGWPQADKLDRFKIGGDQPGCIAGIFPFQGIADHFIKHQ